MNTILNTRLHVSDSGRGRIGNQPHQQHDHPHRQKQTLRLSSSLIWTAPLYENAECFSVLFMTSTTAIQPRQWRQDVAVGESPRSSVSHTSRSPDRGDRNPQKWFLPPLSGLWDLLNSLRGLTPTAISCRPSGADFCRLFSTKWRCPIKHRAKNKCRVFISRRALAHGFHGTGR